MYWIFPFIILFNFVSSKYEYQKYTFYYETHLYSLNNNHENENDPLNINNNDQNLSLGLPINNNNTINNESSAFTSIETSITIDNISIEILKSSNRPYIINIFNTNHKNNTENTNEISINYDDDEQFNSIQIWYTPHRQRRRLRLCTWRHTYRCGWWGWSHCSHHHNHWCSPIAPPRHDKYWNAKWKRVGRFAAYYPSIHSLHYYHYWACAHLCAVHMGGLASIHSKRENDQAKAACWDVLIHPGASNQRDYSGHWRGHSCYIGLLRPFHTWDDRKKVKFSWWYPGEPNNWGNRESCVESYIWHDGRWNDINCHAKRSCICQDPRGIVHGKYVGVQAERPYHLAKKYCNQHYGTELATVINDADNKNAKELCAKINIKSTPSQCWLGLKYPFEEWADGTNAEEKYTNWWPMKPHNGKWHQCTELVTWNPWNGKWNNLHCHYSRFFLCNAQTAVQRMDFHDREELISKRMTRHKMRWEKYQERARRKKIRKQFFDEMKRRRQEMRKQRREQQQKMREYYRQMAFQSAMGKLGGSLGGQYGSGGSGGYGGGGYGAFGATSVFAGDNYGKRRALRSWIESNSESVKRRNDLREQLEAKKKKKIDIFKQDKKKIRETDEGALFYDRVVGLNVDMDDELKEAEENVNPTPMRCLIVKRGKENVYEVCINDDYLEVSKYVDKVLRFHGDDEEEEDIMNVNVNVDPEQENDEYKIIDFEDFEDFKYGTVMDDSGSDSDDDDELVVKNIGMVQYLRINEFIYDHENNHKKQCYDDEDKEYEICLEFREDSGDEGDYEFGDGNGNGEMFLYVEQYMAYMPKGNEYNMISFENDKLWNKVNNIYGRKEKIEKCVNYFQRKICVFKVLTKNIHNQNSIYTKYDEYRIIVMKKMNENDDGNDEYAQMLKSYKKEKEEYQQQYDYEFFDDPYDQ